MRIRDRARRSHHDDGFTLIEMMVSVAIITVVMSALTALYVRSVDASSSLRAKQSAVLVTTQALDNARSIGATAAISGRSASNVAAQFASFSGTPVQAWLNTMDPSSDTAAGDAQLPTSPTQQTIGSTTYSVSYLVGSCQRKYTYSEVAQDCTNDPPVAGFEYLRFVRVVVAVSWSSPSCAQGTCYHAGAVLLNDDLDPLFNINVEPEPPVLSACAQPRELFVGETLTYNPDPALNTGIRIFGKAQPDETQPLCALQGGVPPFQWDAPKLPEGLEIDSHGYIVGTVGGPAGETSDTLTVTDVYQKTSEWPDITWKVTNPVPTITSPGDQRTRFGEPFSLALEYTCPLKDCTFTLEGVPEPTPPAEADEPDGDTESDEGDEEPSEPPTPLAMSISAKGVIHGTGPGAPEVIDGLTVTITAGNGTSAQTVPFSWNFTDGPILDPIDDQEGDVGQAVDLAVSGDCGTHESCEYSVSGTSSWLTIDKDSGHLSGIAAVGTWDFTVTLTGDHGDSDSADFTWTIYDETRIVLSDQNPVWTKGTPIDPITVGIECGRAPCKFTSATWLPEGGGVTFDKATGVISGEPTATGSGTTELSANDGGGRVVSKTLNWTVKPRVETFKNDNNNRCLSASGSSLSLDTSCKNGAQKWYRYDDGTIRPVGDESRCLQAPNSGSTPSLATCDASSSRQLWTVAGKKITNDGNNRYLASSNSNSGGGGNVTPTVKVTSSSDRSDWTISP